MNLKKNSPMNRSLLFFFLFVGCLSTQAQGPVEETVRAIEQNNTTLHALKKQLEARMLGNRTGIYPHGPGFDYAYFRSNPAEIGPKQNVSLTQSFAFPGVYVHQGRIASVRDEQLGMEYQQQRLQVLNEAMEVCIDLVFVNAMFAETEKRHAHASALLQAYGRMLELGETSRLEHNKAAINMASVNQQLERLTVEREGLLAELRRLNGGQAVSFSLSTFPHPVLPADFAQWFESHAENNPVLQWLAREAEISQGRLALARARNLPSFTAGYVSETLAHERFHGWTAGLTIPLWENKNTVKLARANIHAANEVYHDQQLQLFNQLKAAYDRASGIMNSLPAFRQQMRGSDHEALLQKALESGEISLISYLMELSYYYQGIDQLLETEKELALAFAGLYWFSL